MIALNRLWSNLSRSEHIEKIIAVFPSDRTLRIRQMLDQSFSPSAKTSVGHSMSSPQWLRTHYLASEPEYIAMLRSVGLVSGSHVLDAGCGIGSFLLPLAELVGPRGRVTAIDIAPEHVQSVRGRFVESTVADVKALPFKDHTFDVVWNANVAQYLTKTEFREMLAEFKRVLKPGGILAVKDGDITALQIFPIPSPLLWRLLSAWAQRGDQQAIGLLGSLKISRYAVEAKFSHVSRRVTVIHRSAPLREEEAQFVGGLITFFAELAPTLDLPLNEIAMWHEFANPHAAEYILRRKDLYFREAAVLVTGYA
jgi:arsenite methyltransferase